MKITVKELKEMLNKKPKVVETISVGEFKKRLDEMRGGLGLGNGFKGSKDDESKEGKPKKRMKKTPSEVGLMIGDGFKLTEEALKKMNLTKEGLADLVENIVKSLKGKTEYSNLKFVDRIGGKYGMNESHINEMKNLIWEGESGKKLYNYITECGCQYSQDNYGGYQGLSQPYQEMVPQIKRTFNQNRELYKTPKAISVTAQGLNLPMEMVQEMYNIQKEAYKMKTEGSDMYKGQLDEMFQECYERYQRMGEGNLDEMYDEMAEMMEYPMSEKYMEEDYEEGDETEFEKFQKLRNKNPYDDIDDYEDEYDLDDYEDEEEDEEQRAAEFYHGDEMDYASNFYEGDTEMDELLGEMESMLSEFYEEGDEMEENEVEVDGEYYQINPQGDNYFEVATEGWGDEYLVQYVNGEIKGAGSEMLPTEVRQKIIDMATDDEVDAIGEALDKIGQEDNDIDNDGDVDSSDEYLKNRRKKISKAMNRKKK